MLKVRLQFSKTDSKKRQKKNVFLQGIFSDFETFLHFIKSKLIKAHGVLVYHIYKHLFLSNKIKISGSNVSDICSLLNSRSFNLCVIRKGALLDDSKKGCEADQLDNLRCLDTE